MPVTPTAEMTRSTVICCALAARFDRRCDAVALLVELGHLGVGVDLDALLLEALARKRLNLVILDRENLRQHLDDRHVAAEVTEERRKLDADGTGADHQQRLGDRRRHHGFEIGPDQLLVRLQPRQHARPRAGGDDDVLGLIAARRECAFGRFALGGLHRHLAGRVDRSLAPDHRHLVLLHQEADAVVQPLGDGARTLDDFGRVIADIVGFQAIVLGVLEIVVDFGGAQQRLGWDAAPVEADAAQPVALDDGRLEAELRRADGGDIAAGPGTDDEDVEARIRHCTALSSPLPYGDVGPKGRVRG